MELLEYYDKIARFNLNGIQTFGKVVSVYDGDTFDMSFVVPIQQLTKERQLSKRTKGVCFVCNGSQESSILMRMKCRLDGIDARELKSEGGQKAKEILENFVVGKFLRVQIGNYDKYGRLLIQVYFQQEDRDGNDNDNGNGNGNGQREICLNEHLKSFKEYFVSYDGGKKTNSFDEI
jgi:endonuclease YncB( thermonuclease family)